MSTFEISANENRDERINAKSTESEDEDEFSDWTGITSPKPTSILKNKEATPCDYNPGVLNASIQKAKLAAWHACRYGFLEPSEYRDETDPMGLQDDFGSDIDNRPVTKSRIKKRKRDGYAKKAERKRRR